MKTSTDLTEIKNFQKDIQALSSSNEGLDQFFEWATKQLAARLLDRTIKRTPVEENETFHYRMANGAIGTKKIKGGALRRGWVGGRKIGDNPTAAINAHLNELSIINYGRIYQLTVSNNIEYAPYVEYGHKQNVGQFVPYLGKTVDGVRQGATLKKGKVDGKFMMERSANEIQIMAPGLAEKLILEYILSLIHI